MIIYRPHRGILSESMKEVKEFNDEQEMKEYIVKEWDGYFGVDDIIIDNETHYDHRIGWKNVKYVCVKKFGDKDNIAEYGCAQCIGMCSTEYK